MDKDKTHEREDAERDEAGEESFPASDPPGSGETTGPNDKPKRD